MPTDTETKPASPSPPTSDRLRLNVGCGPYAMKGWTNMDMDERDGIDIKADVLAGLPFADGAVDEIYAGHFLEHVPQHRLNAFLKDCRRVLKKRGKMTATVPDIRVSAQMLLRTEIPLEVFFFAIANGLAGYHDDQYKGDWRNIKEIVNPPHQNCFDAEKLFDVFSDAGFVGIVPLDIYRCPLVVSRLRFQSGVEAYRP